MVIRMRHTRSHTNQRRSHHAKKSAVLPACSKCGEPKPPHVICRNCGFYRGKQVLDVLKKLTKKEKKKKEKELEGQEKNKKELSAEELSKK